MNAKKKNVQEVADRCRQQMGIGDVYGVVLVFDGPVGDMRLVGPRSGGNASMLKVLRKAYQAIGGAIEDILSQGEEELPNGYTTDMVLGKGSPNEN